jgi:hypothetical protein
MSATGPTSWILERICDLGEWNFIEYPPDVLIGRHVVKYFRLLGFDLRQMTGGAAEFLQPRLPTARCGLCNSSEYSTAGLPAFPCKATGQFSPVQ